MSIDQPHSLRPRGRGRLQPRLLARAVWAACAGLPLLATAQSTPSTLPAVTVKAEADQSGTSEGTGSYTSTGPVNTATRLPLTLRETPQSVSVITRQRMDDQGLTQLADVITQTPGLVMSTGGNAGSDSSPIFSRGFQVDTYMVDGVRQVDSNYSSIFQTNDMVMFDRVEVVRGATGLMNGIGTPGGGINLVRKRPTADFQASAKVELGSWNARRIEADISSPLNAAGSLRGRIVTAAQQNDSYIDRLEEKRQVLFGTLEADLAPGTLLRVGASLQRHDATGHARGGLPAYYADGTRAYWRRSDSAAANWGTSERHYTSAFAALEHRLSDSWQLQGTLSRSYNEYDEVLAYASGGNPVRETGAGVNLWAGRWTAKPRQDVLDVSAIGKFALLGRQHDLVFGAQMSRTTYDTPNYTNWTHAGWSSAIDNIYTWDGTTPGAPANPSIGRGTSDERLNSAYSTLRFKATDKLAVLLGARVTDWSRYQTTTVFRTGSVSTTDRKESGEITPYLGLVLDLNDTWSTYASYTDIFQPQNRKTVTGEQIDPLLGTNYELGVKAAFLNNRLNFSAALFYVKQDNLAVSIPGSLAPDGSQAYEAVSGTKTRGFDVELSGELQPGWQVSASYTRSMAEDRVGTRLNTAQPQNMAKLYTSYRIPGVAQGLTVGGGLRWQSEIYALNQGPLRARWDQGSYVVADLMARVTLTRQLSASVHVNNLFDKSYYNTTGNSYYGTPRQFGVALQATF